MRLFGIKNTDAAFVISVEILFGVYVGPLPAGEWIIWVWLLLNFNQLKRLCIENKNLMRFSRPLLLLSVVQILTDVSNALDLFYILKGFDTVVMALLHTIFLYSFYLKNANYIAAAFFGSAINYYFFGGDLMEIYAPENFNLYDDNEVPYLKFVILPALTLFLGAMASLFVSEFVMPILFIFIGAMCVFFGCRSGGLVIMMAAFIFYMTKYSWLKRNIILIASVFPVLFFLLYTFYVDKVLAGEISSGNNTELMRLSNPYNPLELFVFSRADVIVPLKAILNSPIIGRSTMPPDYGYKYNKLLIGLKKEGVAALDAFKESSSHFYGPTANIPCHSVLFYPWLCYGLVGFYFFFKSIRLVLHKLIMGLLYVDKYRLLLSLSAAFIMWNLLGSPIGHFKWTFPLHFAVILYVDYVYLNFAGVKQIYNRSQNS